MKVSLTLDHLVYAVPNLSEAIDNFTLRLGLSPILGGRHEGLGTHNAILPLAGQTYLELIAIDPESPTPNQPRPFGLDTLDHPRLVAWAVRSRDIEGDVQAIRERNDDPGIVIPMTRKDSDGEILDWKLAIRPKTLGEGLVPFIIDWGDTRHPSDLASHTKPGSHEPESEARCTLSEFSATHPDPEAIRITIDAMGVDLDIQPGAVPNLLARLIGPGGSLELQDSPNRN